ncbi:MAG: ferredoxin [Deltaproteobacteria bacterium]|nr:ferredoxin [Deltaproteobacteria bacterium]
MSRRPLLDLGECTDCESCVSLCADVFVRNPETGRIEVRDLSAYPEEEIQSAMSMCPADCISWEES